MKRLDYPGYVNDDTRNQGATEKPLLAVTTFRHTFSPNYLAIRLTLWLTGGRIRRVRPGTPFDPSGVHGLILGGGTDVFPALFGERTKPGYRYDHKRDSTELAWLHGAKQHDMPVLGICRGAQIMSVAHDGSLHLAVRKAYRNVRYPSHPVAAMFYRKLIQLKNRSLIQRILKGRKLHVNSLHSQSINRVGQNLVVTAIEENGVIQAIEDPTRPFYLGVQFHPELLVYRKKFREIFRQFVRAAAAYKGSSDQADSPIS